MVTFQTYTDGYIVLINKKTFGYISRDNEFFTSDTILTCFVRVRPQDLRTIADKIDELQGKKS